MVFALAGDSTITRRFTADYVSATPAVSCNRRPGDRADAGYYEPWSAEFARALRTS